MNKIFLFGCVSSAIIVGCGGGDYHFVNDNPPVADAGNDSVADLDSGAADVVNDSANDSQVDSCHKKTCQDIAEECGDFDDGCGGKLDCLCDTSANPFNACGHRVPVVSDTHGTYGTPNKCGGGCAYYPGSAGCNGDKNKIEVDCSTPDIIPNITDKPCVPYNGGSGYSWCCNMY